MGEIYVKNARQTRHASLMIARSSLPSIPGLQRSYISCNISQRILRQSRIERSEAYSSPW